VTDGQTDGQTESIIAKTALCISSYADALSKMTELHWHIIVKLSVIYIAHFYGEWVPDIKSITYFALRSMAICELTEH